MNRKELAALFAEQTLAQQYKLDGYMQSELIKIHTALNHAQTRILNRWSTSDTAWSQTRALAQVNEARAIMDAIKPGVTGSLTGLLGDVSAECSAKYSEMLSFGGRAAGVETVFLSAEQMRSYWRQTPVGGRLLQDWVNKTFDGPTTDAIQMRVFAGMFEGQGFREMSQALREGIVQSKVQADVLVSTYVQSANVHAMDTVYQRNKDVLAGVRWHVTHDNRVCMICGALAGKLFPVDRHPTCPAHPRCRCVLVPETDMSALKVQPQVAQDWAKGVRTPIPKLPVQDYRAWINGRPAADQIAYYGPTRYKMLKAGDIHWDDLVDLDNLRIRRLDELRDQMHLVAGAKAGDAAAAATLAQQASEKLVKQALADAALTNAVDAAAVAKAQALAAKQAAEQARQDKAAARKRAAEKAAAARAAKKAEEQAKKKSEAIKAGLAKKKTLLKQVVRKKAAGERLTAEETKAYQKLGAKKKAALRQEIQAIVAKKQAEEQAAKAAARREAAKRAAAKKAAERRALNAGMDDPDEVITFTAGGPAPGKYKPVAGPDLGQTPVWEPPITSKAGKPISTGAIVIDESTGKVFIVKPKDGYGGYQHTYPKGKLAKGLSAQQNAIKEVWEESGLDVEILDYLGGYEKTTSTTHYYVARVKGGSPTAFLPNETEAVVLVHPDKLKSLLNNAVDKKIAEDFLKSLAKARDFNPDDLAEGFKTLNWRRHLKFVDAADAKQRAAKIKMVKEWMESGAADAPKKLSEVKLAIGVYSGNPLWQKKMEKVAQNLVNMTAAKLKAAKEAKAATAKALKEAQKAAKAAAKAARAAAKEGNVTLDGNKLVWHEAKKEGSNKAAFYRHTETGELYYVKFLEDDLHIDNEILASKLFREAGVNVPELTDVIMPDGKRALASKVIPGVKKQADLLKKSGSAINTAAKKDMAVDAWLANWDVVGLNYDNLVMDAAGNMYHIDVGGSLLFRAQGVAKGGDFGKAVIELETFLTKNREAAAVFGGIGEAEIVAGVRRIAAISEERIRKLVQAYGPGDATQKKMLANTLMARRRHLMDKYGVTEAVDSTRVRYGKADAAFADDVNRLGAQGKSIPTDADMIEDQNVQVFVQKTAGGETQTVIRMKLRPGEGNDAFVDVFNNLSDDSAAILGLKKRGGYSSGTIKCTQRQTRAGECVVLGEDAPLYKMYTEGHQSGMKHKKSLQYTLSYKDRTRVRYVPFGARNSAVYAFQGELEVTIPGKATAESINGALDKLKMFGVDTTPATAANSEKMYLDKIAYIRRHHKQKEWQEMAAATRGKTVEEQIAARKVLLSKYMGVDDVSKLPDYKPDGEYQMGALSGRKDAGQRVQLRPDITEEMLDKEMEHYYIIHNLTDGEHLASLRNIFSGNRIMASNVDKIRHGIPAGGMSPVADAETGGSQYFFTRIADMTKGSWQDSVTHGKVVFKKSLLRRMDCVSRDYDAYGKSYGDYIADTRYHDIDGFKKCATSSSNETDLKQAVTILDNVEVITLESQSQVDEALQMFADMGIHTLPDGRPIQDVVMVGKDWLKKRKYI